MELISAYRDQTVITESKHLHQSYHGNHCNSSGACEREPRGSM